MHYDVVSNSVLWFLFHDLFDRMRRPRFDQRFREAWDAYRTVNDAFADATADAAPDGDVVLVNDYQLSLVGRPAARAAPRSAHRALHAHAVLRARRHARAARRTRPTTLCGALAAQPGRLPHHPLGAARTTSRPVTCSAAGAPIAPTFARQPRARRRRARRRRGGCRSARRPRNALDDAVGDRLVIARTDRIEPSKNIVRGFLAYDRLLEARPGSARPGRVRRDAVSVAPDACRVPRVRERDRAGRRARQRALGDARLDSDPPRRPRRLPPLGRRDAALRRAAREPDQGRAQPRRQGGPGGQPTRRAALPLAPRPARTTSCSAAAIPVHPYDLEDAAGALDRALATPLDERATIATKLRELATARTPADWVADLVAQRECSQRPAHRGAATTDREQLDQARRAVDEHVDRGRQRVGHLGRLAHRSGPRRPSRPSARGARRARRTRRGRRCRHPRTRRRANPSISVVDRGALVDRDRRPQLDREPAVPLGETVAARELGRDARAPPAARSGAVRQCNVTLTPALAFDDHAGQRARRPRRRPPRPPSANGTHARVDPAVTVDHDLHPVETDEDADPGTGSAAARGTRPAARSRSRPARPARRAASSTSIAPGKRDGVFGTVDDRRERSVVVAEDRGRRPAARPARRSLRRRRAQ